LQATLRVIAHLQQGRHIDQSRYPVEEVRLCWLWRRNCALLAQPRVRTQGDYTVGSLRDALCPSSSTSLSAVITLQDQYWY